MLTMNYCQDELQLLETKRIHEEMLKIDTKFHFINKFHDISPGKHRRNFFLNSVLFTYFNSKPNIYVAEISNCLLNTDLFCFIWETSQKGCSFNEQVFSTFSWRIFFPPTSKHIHPVESLDWCYCWVNNWDYSYAQRKCFWADMSHPKNNKDWEENEIATQWVNEWVSKRERGREEIVVHCAWVEIWTDTSQKKIYS